MARGDLIRILIYEIGYLLITRKDTKRQLLSKSYKCFLSFSVLQNKQQDKTNDLLLRYIIYGQISEKLYSWQKKAYFPYRCDHIKVIN